MSHVDTPEQHWGESDLVVHLRFMSGWGRENLTRAAGWISEGVRWRTARSSSFEILLGRGGPDNVEALLNGAVNIAFTTPMISATWALTGHAPFDRPHPNLRALAALPHRDRLLFALTPEAARRYQIETLADLVAKRPPLRIATGLHDGSNIIGLTVERTLAAHGMAWDDLTRWGGQWVCSETPHPAIEYFAHHEVDGLFFEAITLWQKLLGRRRMRFLALAPEAIPRLRAEGFEFTELEGGE
ncbi:MAG TPA: hypothetical protein VKQ36_15665, partial [Ktedonobacterales bacterium]|nr:hypothetical protein [Ktedonobacterales bacterium]